MNVLPNFITTPLGYDSPVTKRLFEVSSNAAVIVRSRSALHERYRLVVANYVPKLDTTRLTITLPVLNHAHHVMFLVAGEHKADAVRAVLHAGDDHPKLPAQLVRPEKGTVLWLVDKAAGRRLRFEGRGSLAAGIHFLGGRALHSPGPS